MVDLPSPMHGKASLQEAACECTWLLPDEHGCILSILQRTDLSCQKPKPLAPLHGHVQVLAWLQPSLTEAFVSAAFHAKTLKEQPHLIDKERHASNGNPPYMFKAFHRQVQLPDLRPTNCRMTQYDNTLSDIGLQLEASA